MPLGRRFLLLLTVLATSHAALSQAAAKAKSTEAASPIPATTIAITSPTPLSERVVSYQMEAKYDAVKHTLDGNEVLTYHNLSSQALERFPYHLYLDASPPKATWVREARAMGSRDTTYEKYDDKDRG